MMTERHGPGPLWLDRVTWWLLRCRVCRRGLHLGCSWFPCRCCGGGTGGY